jgi:hypothetical protein
MRVLEARFCSREKEQQEFIVVGHVVWENETENPRPVVQPSVSLLMRGEPATILSKLQYLVLLTAPDSFVRLQNLRSRVWSFVEVATTSVAP